jgi:hypothetical protein
MVVAALRQRRIANPLCETKKPPGKTGRFLFRRNRDAADADKSKSISGGEFA